MEISEKNTHLSSSRVLVQFAAGVPSAVDCRPQKTRLSQASFFDRASLDDKQTVLEKHRPVRNPVLPPRQNRAWERPRTTRRDLRLYDMSASKFFFLVPLILVTMSDGHAQDLSAYQWKNRLVLLLTDAPQPAVLQEQLEAFRLEEEGLKERKILVCQAEPERYRAGLETGKPWIRSADPYDRYKRTAATFEVVLIGLDGGVKLHKTGLLTVEELFGTIDQMPMRRAEMRRKNG